MRVVLMTSNELRHRFAANRLAASMNMVGVVSEMKAPAASGSAPASVEDQRDVQKHFAERDEVERRFFGRELNFPATGMLSISSGEANSSQVFEWVQRRDPDVIVLYGTSIIKPPLLTLYGERMINLHLGLSPYYRGSGTNFWPLVNSEPECVGATIHLAVAKVDAGAILAQVRPEAEISDRSHELGTKTLMAALDTLPRATSLFLTKEIEPKSQDLSRGRVFRSKDFTAESLRVMWRNFESGMMREYLSEAAARCRAYPIVELEN